MHRSDAIALLTCPGFFLLLILYALVRGLIEYALGWQLRRAERRRYSGCCANCGYDLRGSTDTCPECGVRFRSDPPAPERKRKRRRRTYSRKAPIKKVGGINLPPALEWPEPPIRIATGTGHCDGCGVELLYTYGHGWLCEKCRRKQIGSAHV